MSSGLILVLLVASAFVAAHFAFERLGKRFLIVSGAEYLALGILLGPQVSGIFTPALLDSLAAFPALALGWMGAIIGMRFYLPELIRIPGFTYRIALSESLLTVAVVFALEALAFMWLFDISLLLATPPALALAAIAVSSSRETYEIVSRHLGEGAFVTQLDISTAINAFVAVLTFGWLLAAFHANPTGAVRPLTSTEWLVLSAGIGLIGGALFHLFLGREDNIDRLFVALAGVLILVSGAAAYLGLSPLLAALFFGIMLVNTSRNRIEIAAALTRVERPLYFVLLIFAGATWQPSLRAWVAPVLLFVFARAAAKIGAARIGARMERSLPLLGPNWGRALLGQGGVAIALGIDYLQQDHFAFAHVVFTAVVASVLLTDMSSARLAKSVFAAIPESGGGK
ncbi:MAG: hypothetical protein H0W42_01105 [Gemmatimonadaceae bacterium]|nr:hypothetical protein [Gemmatimonadaceae bacterium]